MKEQEPQSSPEQLRRERRVLSYVYGLDTGNLELVQSVLLSAQGDPELERMIVEVNAELYREMEREAGETGRLEVELPAEP